MLNFVVAILLLFMTPGPGVLSLAGVGSAFGYRAGLTYMFGLFLGTNVVALTVVTGLAAILLADDIVRALFFWTSIFYLVFLAYRIAFSGSKIAFAPASSAPGIGGGITLQVINPKAYVVNTALFTGFPIVPDSFWLEIAIKFAIVNFLWICVHLFWLWIGVSIHRLDLKPRTHLIINIAMAAAMLAVVALAAFTAA